MIMETRPKRASNVNAGYFRIWNKPQTSFTHGSNQPTITITPITKHKISLAGSPAET
jgi:hypothetical protein